MKFEPYWLWHDPVVVAYQEPSRARELIATLPPGAHLLFHCPTSDCLRFFIELAALQAVHPTLRFHAIANGHDELLRYRSYAPMPSAYGPVALYIDERRFWLIEDGERAVDAIYVAHFEPGNRQHFKRHALAQGVQRLHVVTYPHPYRAPFRAEFYATYPELAHAEVNDHYVAPEELTRAFSRASVNLALSAAEGCMLAFTEGLLCGVPGVSTPCRSARSQFFSPDSVLLVDANVAAVRAGVQAMKERRVDRAALRSFALGEIERMRAAYTVYIARIVERAPDVIDQHLFRQTDGVHRLQRPIRAAS
jgi:hypothetical protein